MKITVIYDNCLAKAGLRTGWGFSSLIEIDDTPPLLFDTAADGATLLYNMKQLGIEPRGIGIVVISHAHGDHTGGLFDILEVNRGAEIYLPASSLARFPVERVIPVRRPAWISEGVFSTGELNGIEQSLNIRGTPD